MQIAEDRLARYENIYFYVRITSHTHMSPHRFGEIIIFRAHFYVTLCFCIKLSRLPQKVAVSIVSLHSSCSAKQTCGKYSFSKIASYSHTVVFIVVVVFTILLLSSSSPQYTNASYQSTEPHIVNENKTSESLQQNKLNKITTDANGDNNRKSNSSGTNTTSTSKQFHWHIMVNALFMKMKFIYLFFWGIAFPGAIFALYLWPFAWQIWRMYGSSN